MNKTFNIKNMVCPRCVEAVSQVFEQLELPLTSIELGEATLKVDLTQEQQAQLATMLEDRGFELLEDKKSKQISQIKSLIIQQIHHREAPLEVNFSTLISDHLHQEYSSLSKLFSSVEGITIEKFILKQKIEKVKELLFYNEMALSQIAYQLGYSSVAHLSVQFKKETGMSPSHFKKLRSDRKPLDSI
ncbi:AraC family transcriptional regulator [Tunicatimonas pelagia]|uniref:AraC family transcriptional regulator n=1 Tax=Tunicatimonas pelagia TaxID=931531 RepID=UPI0026660CA1|nr:AraC family transcriptional regulator [Tunicatimonas pelagia]WKN45398.1 AraC family transcriptional regulator [Tunicatimonas pelagia]